MSEQEFNPELIREIEEFLRQQREATLADVRPEWRDLIPRIHAQIERVKEIFAQSDIPMKVVPREQAVVESEELSNLARGVGKLVLLTRFSGSEGPIDVRTYPTSDFEAFTVGLTEHAIPSFFPTGFIMFENWHSGNISEDEPLLAESLGIGNERPVGCLTIGKRLGAITDPQTRSVMDRVVTEFPDVPLNSYTNYYFFEHRIGKVMSLPPDLLGERLIKGEYSQYALSEISRGDLAIAKVGIHAIEQAMIPYIPTH